MSQTKVFQAFALGFPRGDASPPAVMARGEFDAAAFMVSVARRYGIPIVEKPEMCAMLEEVEVGQSIPESLFEAAAALLVEIGALGKPSARGRSTT
jgi:type III secretion system FlhB-like substrate exporter